MNALHDARVSVTEMADKEMPQVPQLRQVSHRGQLELRQILQHLRPVGALGLILVQPAAGLDLLLQGVGAEHSGHGGA